MRTPEKGRPTWDDMKARKVELEAIDERVRALSALIDIGIAVVREWDDSDGYCPWCAQDDGGHRDRCPGRLVEAFEENHRHFPTTPTPAESGEE